jgi:Spy/CpxP family protein refolding chaperone
MKKVRFALMVTAIFLGVTTAARAQEPQQQGRGGRGQVTALFKDITLTDAQTAKRDSIVAKYREQMQALRSEAQSGDRQAAMTKMRDLQAKQREEFKALLTDEQKKVFDKNVEELQQRMQQRPPSGV